MIVDSWTKPIEEYSEEGVLEESTPSEELPEIAQEEEMTQQEINSEEENMNLRDEILEKIENEMFQVRTEARPQLRGIINDMVKEGKLTKELASPIRREVRDGNKQALAVIACALRATERRATEEAENGTEEQPQTEEKPQTEEQPQKPSSVPDVSEDRIDRLEDKVETLADAILQNLETEQMTTEEKPTNNGLIEHWALDRIIPMVEANKQILLVGGAGTGKTTMARQINEKLGFTEDDFYSISLSAGVSEAHLTGRMLIDGKFLDTKFLEIVEKGGTILLDEFDNADPDVLVGLNSLLANFHVNVPLRNGDEKQERNQKCYILCSANTWGSANSGGGDAGNYVRKELDGATLDRFTCSKWQLDEDLRIVDAIFGLTGEDKSFDQYPKMKISNAQIQNPKRALLELRDLYFAVNANLRVEQKQLNRECSPRFAEQGVRLIMRGWKPMDILKIYLQDWTDDELRAIGAKRDISKAKFGITEIKINKREFTKALRDEQPTEEAHPVNDEVA